MISTITIVAAIVIVLLLLKFATKFIAKIFGILLVAGLVIGFMYYKSIGPFKQNVTDIYALEEKYCDQEVDKDICDCIIKNIKRDMKRRFTRAELDSLAQQRIKAAYVLKKSMNSTKTDALNCLESRDAAHKYKQFRNDFIPIENKYLEIIEDKAKELGDNVRQEIKDFLLNKDDIDDKY